MESRSIDENINLDIKKPSPCIDTVKAQTFRYFDTLLECIIRANLKASTIKVSVRNNNRVCIGVVERCI